MSPCCLSPRPPGRPTRSSKKRSAAHEDAADSAKFSDSSRARSSPTAAAWSPNPKKPPLYLDLPIEGRPTAPRDPRAVGGQCAAGVRRPVHRQSAAVPRHRDRCRRPGRPAQRTRPSCTTCSIATVSRTAFEIYQRHAHEPRRRSLPESRAAVLQHDPLLHRHVSVKGTDHEATCPTADGSQRGRHEALDDLAILVCLTALASAQESTDFRPASTNVWDAQYPRVDSKGRVEIRLKAPDAAKVRLNFWSGPKIDMVKQPDGVWSVITEPLVPGLHYYTSDCGRRGNGRHRQPLVLRRQQVRERRRGARARLDVLLDPGRAARTGPRGLVLLESHRHLAPRGGVRAARVRREDDRAVSSALPAARWRRGRDRVGATGACQQHPRQPDRERQGETDAGRDGVRLRAPRGRASRPTSPARASEPPSSGRRCRT